MLMRSIIIALARIIAGRRSASTVSVTHDGRTVPGTDDYGFFVGSEDPFVIFGDPTRVNRSAKGAIT
jgi:hypothetical protein